jgi:DNA-directed RNA polymerase subunit RPC12/RpoP
MKFTDLSITEANSLLYDLTTTYDIAVVEEKYGFSIPQWLTIKYKCVACAKETRSRIQAINIRQANRQLTCPFCRKISEMFTIHIEKGGSILTS